MFIVCVLNNNLAIFIWKICIELINYYHVQVTEAYDATKYTEHVLFLED